MASKHTLPATQIALKVDGPGKVVVAESEPLPAIGSHDILVHNACVGLNPFDSKSVDSSPSVGATIGGDFAGEIAALGEAVPAERFQIGDRVFGCVFGNNPNHRGNGAFAEYVAVPADFVIKMPPTISFQQAATLGIGLATTGLALYKGLGLPMSFEETKTTGKRPDIVLVYGGGTATGALAIQVIRRSGLTPITTCSPGNFDHVKSLGAEAAFDYRSQTCGSEIRDYCKDRLRLALDCITNSGSMKICYEAIGTKGGKYLGLDPFPLNTHTRRSIQPDWIFLFTQFGEAVNWKRPYNLDARPQDREIARRWYRMAEKLLWDGDITPHPHQVELGGLQAVDSGLDAVRKGMVSGYKLVYPI